MTPVAPRRERRPSPGVITEHDATFVLNLVRTICSDAGPGLPGTSQERQRGAIIRRELETCLGAENVFEEEFTCAPGAFLGTFPICAALTLSAALFNASIGQLTDLSSLLTAGSALALSILSVLVFTLEFVFGLELVDPFFRQSRSSNVIGALRTSATNDVKRLLIVSGHHDSALENTWFRFLGYGAFPLIATSFIAFITMLMMGIVQFTGVVTRNNSLMDFGTLGWLMFVYPIVPGVICGLFFTHGSKNGGIVPGAVDNLSASALAVALCRFLVDHSENIPADTEIRFISFGSEEAGLRGSRRYVARHLAELLELDARVLNVEMVAYPEITILTSEKSGTVQNSPAMVRSVVAAAERAGVPYRLKGATIGEANDAGSFSKAGLAATTIIPFRMPQQLVAFYHQKWDCPEVLSIEPLLNVLKLALEWVRSGASGDPERGRPFTCSPGSSVT
jgi:peptidase M28-like protein